MKNIAYSVAGPDSMEQLLGDCAQMTPHWRVPPRDTDVVRSSVTPQALHGVRVPARYARLLDGMSEYGN